METARDAIIRGPGRGPSAPIQDSLLTDRLPRRALRGPDTAAPEIPRRDRRRRLGTAAEVDWPADTLEINPGLPLVNGSVPSLQLEAGPWDPLTLNADPAPVIIVVVSGLIVRDHALAGTIATELLGPGDLVELGQDGDAFVAGAMQWTVLEPTRLAVLDARVLSQLGRHPELAARLLQRAGRQIWRGTVHRAIAQLPRVELRLLGLLWHLAERYGRVSAAGVVVPIELRHETLGRLIGARRPTVSLAVKALADDGSVLRRADGAWVVRHDSLDALDGLLPTDWRPSSAVVVRTERTEELVGTLDPRGVATIDAAAIDALRERFGQLQARLSQTEATTRNLLARCAEDRDRARTVRALSRASAPSGPSRR